MKRLCFAAILAMLVASQATARAPDVDGIRHWSTGSFDIYSPIASQARTVAEQIPSIQLVLSRLLNKDVVPSGIPVVIYIAPQAIWHRYLRPSASIVAEFVLGRFAHYIVMNSYMDHYGARESIRHEYAHLFLRSQYAGELPLWFDEGIAEIAGLAEFLRDKARIGLPRHGGGNWIPMERLLRADKQSPEYLSHTTTHQFHLQSWALVHKGIFDDREFGKSILAYLRVINAQTPIDEAVQSSFGMNVAELDRTLAGYLRRGQLNIAKFPVHWPPRSELGAGRRTGQLESLELLARIMFDTGLNPSRLGEVITAARKLAPASPSVRVLALRLAARDGNDAEVEAAWRELEAQSTDPTVARGAALALFENLRAELLGERPAGPALAARAERVFALLSRAERALPVDAESAWAFGLTCAFLGRDADFALQRLAAADAMVPRNGDLAMALAMLHERLEQPDQMRAQLANTARYSRSSRQILWAKVRLADHARETTQP